MLPSALEIAENNEITRNLCEVLFVLLNMFLSKIILFCLEVQGESLATQLLVVPPLKNQNKLYYKLYIINKVY